jgi:amino-acid N-acetyltransferase
VRIINGILKLYRHEGFLKPRTEAYLREQRSNFYVTLIDDIVVGCVEKKVVNSDTVEIAALAISTKFRNQRIGVFTLQAFMDSMRKEGFQRFLSLTNNPSLKRLYLLMGFGPCARPEYRERQAASPGVSMFYKEV